MASDLNFLASLTERELTELVVIPLLEKLRYQDIRYTHGVLEHGKDIVCIRPDLLEGPAYIGFVIKIHTLRGSVSGNQSVRTAFYQAQQALTEPFLSPIDGAAVTLKHVYILTSRSIDQLATASIQTELKGASRHISFIDGPRLLSLVQDHLPGLLSSIPDPTQVYLLGIRQRFLQLSTAISLGSQREFRLTDIYTGGGLTPTTPQEAAYLSFADLKLKTASLPAKTVYHSCPFLIFLADVGAGKTTLLKKLALDLVSDTPTGNAPDVIPIFIELSSVPRGAVKSLGSFHDWLATVIGKSIKGGGFSAGQETKFLLLLDGFDEMPSGHSALEEYLFQILPSFPAGVIMTSRPSRIPSLGEPFRYFRLDPFSPEEMQYFLGLWFQNEERVADLMGHIKSDDTLFGFCRTPLLLTLYAVLEASDSLDRMPTRKAEIYESLATLLLGRWDSMRKVMNQFSADLKTYVLEQLAFELHEKGRKVFEKADFIAIAAPLLTEPQERHRERISNPDSARKADLLFDELLFRSSLIRRHELGHFYFSHLSFQEFFCSRYLIRSGDKSVVQRILFTEWWKNVLTFYFGVTRSMDGIRISSKKASEKGQVLIEYLAEADYTSSDQREAIYKRVGNFLLSSSPLPASVIEACRRLGDGLLLSMEDQLDGATDRVTMGFFDLCLQMGKEGVTIALRHVDRLDSYPAPVASHVVLRSAAQVGTKTGHRMFDRALRSLDRKASVALRKLSRAHREELLSTIRQDLRGAVKRLSLITDADSRLRSRIIDDVKETQRRLEHIASAS